MRRGSSLVLGGSYFTIGALLLTLLGCAKPADYGPFRAALPHSILVLPPLNNTVDVQASETYLSTVTRPIAELGYYVFPVAVVDAYMKDNGLPTPYEMHSVSLTKLQEVFGAEAVLYIEIEEWGQKYRIVSSDAVVELRARLVDIESAETIWRNEVSVVESSNQGGGDAVGMLIGALVTQIVNSSQWNQRSLATRANYRLFHDRENGLLLGPRHPESVQDLRGR